MFFICKKRKDGKFGVMDTVDGVVEYYTPNDIIKFTVKLHVEINGVVKNANGKYTINVLEPREYNIKSINDVDCDYNEKTPESTDYRKRYLDLPMAEIVKLSKDLITNLDSVLCALTGMSSRSKEYSFTLLDGIDCVGFDEVPVFNTGYSVSVYSNPDCTEKGIVSEGFGMDLYKDGKLLEDGHFDGLFKTWKKEFEYYKYKNVFFK